MIPVWVVRYENRLKRRKSLCHCITEFSDRFKLPENKWDMNREGQSDIIFGQDGTY